MKSTNYLLIKLAFRTPVHFGKGRLATSEMTIGADRLFSSLYQQALKTPEGERLAEQLVASVKNGTLRLSDTFPYMENKWYLPKPVMRLTLKKEGNAIQKKSLKKLSFIPSALFPAFLHGEMEPEKELTHFERIGEYLTRHAVSLRNDSQPFRIGLFQFSEGSGLYFILYCSDDEVRSEILALVDDLSFEGIGGKRTIGQGRFDYEVIDASPSEWKILEPQMKCVERDRLFMMLSAGFPRKEECASIQGRKETIVGKRSGFIQSPDYAKENVRKKDFFLYLSGSCFERPFSGDIFDVGGNGTHPVFRYASPLWMELM